VLSENGEFVPFMSYHFAILDFGQVELDPPHPTGRISPLFGERKSAGIEASKLWNLGVGSAKFETSKSCSFSTTVEFSDMTVSR
jgi:hypothetical protein